MLGELTAIHQTPFKGATSKGKEAKKRAGKTREGDG